MVVFTLFFKGAADIDTGPAPYSLFAYLGLLPWGFFSTSVSQGGVSLVTNVSLLNKVYCPREVFPLASVCLALVDTTIACSALVVLFLIEGYAPHATAVYVPLLLAVLFAFTIGIVLITSSVVVYLRDLRTTLPLILQLGLFASPVAYGLDKIPARARPLYAATNPLVSVIDGLRRTVLFGQAPRWGLLALSATTSVVVLAFGYWLFKRLEGGIADVA
jgi:ABC-2 type transport system permease protein/lipopolysaccharide transport system permease protein